MIKLTKLNKETFYLNALYIQQVDSTPDTVITLVSGRKMIVLEHADEVFEKVTAYYRQLGLHKLLNDAQRFPSEENDARFR